jgi:hypothetical protein
MTPVGPAAGLSLIRDRGTTMWRLLSEPSTAEAITWPNRWRNTAVAKGVRMSDCLHCDIHEMLESHLQSEQTDLAETAAKVTEVLADLILMAPPDEQTMMMADVVANLGGMVLEKSQDTDPTNPRRSSH